MGYDIGIVGLWQYNNFGSALTALSLYKVLEREFGLNPILIDTDLCNPPKGKNGFDSDGFLRTYCHVSKKFHGEFGLLEANELCDAFVVGSDQCWRSGFVRVFRYMMFLDFADDTKKKLSYSTSFGVDRYEGDAAEKRSVGEYLRRFDAVSVREKSGIDICRDEFGVQAEFVADPILLAGRDLLDEVFVGGSEATKPFLLCYCLDANENFLKLVTSSAESLALPVRFVFAPDGTNDENVSLEGSESDIGLHEWVSSFKEASFVITDSYHGLCLCLAYNKPFISIYNEMRGRERTRSLLELTGLMDRGVEKNATGFSIDGLLPVHWDAVNSILDNFKTDSLKWLEEALSKKNRSLTGNWERNIILKLATAYQNSDDRILALENRIREANRRIVVDYFEKKLKYDEKIAFRGGGFHTAGLIDALSDLLKKKDVTVKYIFDRDVSHRYFVPEGCIVLTPDHIDEVLGDIDVIIISSTKYRKNMAEELEKFSSRVKVIDMYADLDCFGEGKAFYDI